MTEIHDLLEIAQRAGKLRSFAPAPLRINLPRQRDGPREYYESKPAPERVTGPHSAPQWKSAWNWKSKGSST